MSGGTPGATPGADPSPGPAGDGAALLALYDRALPQVYGYLLPRVGSTGAAEDLTAETFLAAVTAVQRGGVPHLTVAWLVGVARHKLVDHALHLHAGAAEAIDFYRLAFGAVEQMRMTGGDGRIGHAEITIGGALVMLSDEHPEIGVVAPATLGGTPMALHLEVDDVDAVYARSLAAGATGERAPADQFHGHRTATVLDPFGHRWTLTAVIEDLSLDELARRAPGYTTTSGDRGTHGEPGAGEPGAAGAR